MRPVRLGRRELGGVFAAMATAAGPAGAQGTAYPSRPIRVVVAWPAGGGVDTPIRLVSQPMSRFLGQPLVLDNRGGATGSIGEAEAARATPDGYTILGTGLSMITNPMLLRNLPYDPVTAFVPICQLISAPLLLVVRADHPARSLTELLEMCRARPGHLTFFSSGLVGGPHMTGLMLLRRAGVTATHVSYRGGSQSIAGVMGGDTDFGFSTLPQAVPLVREARLRALAVSSPERLPSLPEVPTVAEQGFPGFERAEASNLWALAGTPAAAISRLHEAAVAALAEPEVLARLEILGMTPVGSTPAQLGSAMDEYRRFAAEMIRTEGIRVE
ncbi:exported protein [Siccirubricoccus deserti]|uniref:Tripartite tricarboxylate transporter substrate binding protein n=1 Tax=Siccirubricoccus deserti TaxID=2013562 RepID=A0A9X0QXW6_9PROT|nr:tripartite tricarboxylate transporter substrate binding protein [Siccirubricoccus deserti]MBC4015966.1 tripartite tricarboxylate transporter substrate binding protein [Siccirubricoccus deserti]GGC39522.1 exported protein [Siccirubricoccus deserti]